MTVLVTGAAGFIGFHVSRLLLDRGETVVGVDNLNSYYDVSLKHARLAELNPHERFVFHQADIADRDAMEAIRRQHPDIDRAVHLAAQAGVRHSLTDPFAYAHSNLIGHLVILEMCRAIEGFRHLVYASSSSVYGANTRMPFSIEDRVDSPVSLYGATKRADELMSYSYSHLYAIPATGLRFFTVYGPWGRPDMAAYIFTRKIIAGEPLEVFNGGDMKRDFTYIDDIVQGVVNCLDRPPAADEAAPHRVYNIGNHRSEPLMRFIGLLEQAIGRKAEVVFKPMQPGDVKETYADIEALRQDIGFEPSTPIDEGLPRFVEWYRRYHRLN
ncbi:MAG: NAD-dependent epimerase/dehydratase family protein [Acetobacterales bacterium]